MIVFNMQDKTIASIMIIFLGIFMIVSSIQFLNQILILILMAGMGLVIIFIGFFILFTEGDIED